MAIVASLMLRHLGEGAAKLRIIHFGKASTSH